MLTIKSSIFQFPRPCQQGGMSLPQEVRKKGEGTARRADPSWPKGYAMPYDVALSNKNWRKGEEGPFVVKAFVFQSNHYAC